MNENLILVFGNFNIVHPGHLRLLRYAKSFNKKVIVGLFSDNIAGDAIYVPQNLRSEALLATEWVDEVIIVDHSVEDIILELKPFAVIKGKEHENSINPEETIIKSYGGNLFFSSGEVTFSSLNLLRKEYLQDVEIGIKVPKHYLTRHKITADVIDEALQNFSKSRICIVGDTIVDKYTTCEPLGMSQEDPTVVVKPISSQEFIGGAAIVARHAKSLGAKTHFISVVGDDTPGEDVLTSLDDEFDCHIIKDPSRPTSVKERFRAKNKTLLRVSNLIDKSVSTEIQDDIYKKIKNIVKSLDALIFSDFNYGCLPQELVNKIVSLANQHSIPVFADSQSSSQVGDVSRYKDIFLISATEREARLALRDNESGLVVLVEKLIKITNAKYVVIKLGEEGTFLHVYDESQENKFLTDRIPALNPNSIDTAGAGDSMLISMALSMLANENIWVSAYIGSLAASIQVERVGNIPIEIDELRSISKKSY